MNTQIDEKARHPMYRKDVIELVEDRIQAAEEEGEDVTTIRISLLKNIVRLLK